MAYPQRETRPCNNCGEPTEIIPAGTSKKTGKAYGSFMKCKACGKAESIGPQPPRAGTAQGVSKDFIHEQLRLLNDKMDKVLRMISQADNNPPSGHTESLPF